MEEKVKSKKSFRGENFISKMKILLRKMKILLRGENVPGDMLFACYFFHNSQNVPAASIVNKLWTIKKVLDIRCYKRYNEDAQMSKQKKWKWD